MNPLPVVWSIVRRNSGATLLFVLLIAAAVALGAALSMQERALRQGGAAAADRFDLIVAAPGSQTALLMSVVYLRPDPGPLLDPKILAKLLADPDAELVAPIGFGDSYRRAPVVGTTAAFATHLAGQPAEGRMFATEEEAVVGAASPLAVGAAFRPVHGLWPVGAGGVHEHGELRVVGRMVATGTPWDGAIIVPIEQVWSAHAMPMGRPDDSKRIGPPFDADRLGGVPAVVVRPKDGSIAKAYSLRQRYRTAGSTAFFPAETLVQLYAVMGDAKRLMSLMAIASHGLVVAAILAAVLAIMQINRQRLAVLRAIGAPRSYILAVVWSYVVGVLTAGSTLGLGAGLALAWLASGFLGRETGVVFAPALSWEELQLAAVLLAGGCLLALIPAAALYRRPLVDALDA
jgi:putative ABC transport system permease protein